MNLSDGEMAADENNTTNKIACSTEKTLSKLNGDGLNRNELITFEAQIKGGSSNHKFFQNFIVINKNCTETVTVIPCNLTSSFVNIRKKVLYIRMTNLQ